ncbi:Cof-type HAD-IIB family hydrolase [Effusibacillus dendaii]|uniref:Hydrolase n=1 Tax=Effusibacillus dendaii TaxID=2743772 RepID=A0A7I8DA73_9BACL|nr:Cof-type HAD-IIB family hydrolase [Effusibacillus dendaii]BCJ86995.1 hydrolase [Effusibacillus dendaii]
MTRRRLIAIDLDGTMLTNEKKILDSTKTILKKVTDLGHEVVIATGRPPRSSRPYHEELGLTSLMINFNGALIHNPFTRKSEFHFPMDRQIALEILHQCQVFEVENVLVEVEDRYYAKKVDALLRFFGDGTPPTGLGEIETFLIDHPTSMMVHSSEEVITALRARINKQFHGMVAHRYWSAEPFHVIEITKAGISKATGLMTLASVLGFERQDVIAFGDEGNDLEMIKWAGVGVAMGNANPILKEVADQIADTNENDGIARMLEKLLLL